VLLPVVPSKSRLPALTSFLFCLDTTTEVGKVLTVVASDGDIFLTTVVVPVNSDSEEGCFLIDARTLVGTLKLIPEQPVRLVIEECEKGHLITLHFEGGKYELRNSFDVGTWPIKRLPAPSAPDPVLLPRRSLIAALECAPVCAAKDDILRPVMSSVYFDFTAKGVNFVASDGHKLMRFGVPFAIFGDTSRSFALPLKAAGILKNLLKAEEGEDEPVQVRFDDDVVVFSGRFELSCMLLEGSYPRYANVIPAANPISAVIDRMALIAALRRADVFVNLPGGLIEFHISKDSVRLVRRDSDFGRTTEEFLPITLTEGLPATVEDDTAFAKTPPETLVLGFNVKFLLDLIPCIPTERIIISVATHDKPALLLPDTEEDCLLPADITLLVMPQIINV
jgi:DNA polymerase-3 subunit beta